MKRRIQLLITLTDDYRENRADGEPPGQVIVTSHLTKKPEHLSWPEHRQLQREIVERVAETYIEKRYDKAGTSKHIEIQQDITNFNDDDHNADLN